MNEPEGTDEAIKPTLNEILKPYGLKIVVISEENDVEYEPEKLVEIARISALLDLEFEVRKIGE